MRDKNLINEQKKILLIINQKDEKINVVWDEYSSNTTDISILEYIEKNSSILKAKYINLVNEIGFLKIKNKNLIDCFLIKKNFSYWWITDIYEKSIYKDASINEIIKLLAFEKILKDNKIQKVIIKNFDIKLTQSMKLILKNLDIDFEFVDKKYFNYKNILFFKIIFSFLNFLRFLSKRISFNKTHIKNTNIRNLFCSYFAYIDLKKLNKNIYHSDFWNGLINKNNPIIKDSHFLHIFFPTKKISYSKSLKAIKRINKNSNNNSNNKHFFIEELFSVKIFFKIIKFWILNILKFKLNKKDIKKSFIDKNLSSWFFFEDELVENFCGTSVLINMYYFYLFEKLSKNLPSVKKTFFLYENQGWEKSFIFNFKKIEYNKIFAVQHSTVRFWDLRYSTNTSINFIFENFQPHYFCVNGDDSMKKFITAGYPLHKLKKIEAVRYNNILRKRNLNFQKKNHLSSILIAGDYSNESNLNISSAINGLDKEFSSNFIFTLKEHPLREMSDLLNIKFTKSQETIEVLSNDHNYAIVSNTTSAAVDLYLLGFKLIVIIDRKNINLSPLKDREDVIFLYDQDLLSNYLNKLLKSDKLNKNKTDFFYYSPNYVLWNNLINE